MKPSAQHMNWLLNRTYNVLKALQENGDITQIEQELSDLETEFTKHAGDKTAHITSQERTKWNTAEQTVTQNKDSWSWNGNKVLDTRTHKATVSYYRSFPWMTRTHYEFKNPADVDLGAEYFINADNYASVETFVPWSDTSGGGIVQIAHISNGLTVKRNSYMVNGTETWSGWRPLNATNQRLNNMDFNRYIAPGVYAVGATPLNAPGSGDWGLLIVEVSGDVVIQTSKGMNNNIWTRFKTNAQTWSAWEQVLTTIHYNQLFQSVSNGKTAVASAISDKGVYTSPVETFANMANNIRLIQTGAVSGSGSYSPTTWGQRIWYANISGLPFRPREIMILAGSTHGGASPKDMRFFWSERLGTQSFIYKPDDGASTAYYIGSAAVTPNASGFSVRFDIVTSLTTGNLIQFTYVVVP